jgi:hypothetical protein
MNLLVEADTVPIRLVEEYITSLTARSFLVNSAVALGSGSNSDQNCMYVCMRACACVCMS